MKLWSIGMQAAATHGGGDPGSGGGGLVSGAGAGGGLSGSGGGGLCTEGDLQQATASGARMSSPCQEHPQACKGCAPTTKHVNQASCSSARCSAQLGSTPHGDGLGGSGGGLGGCTKQPQSVSPMAQCTAGTNMYLLYIMLAAAPAAASAHRWRRWWLRWRTWRLRRAYRGWD